MEKKNISIIVPGGLNTDIIGLGMDRIVGIGESASGGTLKIGPGGKSRNIAQMMAEFIGPEKVAMIAKTCKDKYGLWKPPYDALERAGVNTDYIEIIEEEGKYPGIALIPVDKKGRNQIYVLPGITGDFTESDIDNAEEIFKIASRNNGLMALSLEMPLKTAIYAVKKANENGLKVILDPGGMAEDKSYDELLNQNIYLIKPNEHEAKMLTGVEITDIESAKEAYRIFHTQGIKNVLITAGENGAFLITPDLAKHIPIANIKSSSF